MAEPRTETETETETESRTVELWVARHGRTPRSAAGQYSGWADVELTREGEQEALALGERLSGVEFDEILASPLRRAMRTAQLATGRTARPDPRAREWDFGRYDGLTLADIRVEVPGWSAWTHPAMPDGEHLDDVIARAQGLVKELVAPGTRRVLLVSHGSFLRILASQWIHQDAGLARHLRLGTAKIGILGLDQDRPMIERWNF